jgi:transposase-like protein
VKGAAVEKTAPAETPRIPVPSKEAFLAAYQELGGSVRGLARHFGRDRRQIYRWLTSYGLDQKTD